VVLSSIHRRPYSIVCTLLVYWSAAEPHWNYHHQSQQLPPSHILKQRLLWWNNLSSLPSKQLNVVAITTSSGTDFPKLATQYPKKSAHFQIRVPPYGEGRTDKHLNFSWLLWKNFSLLCRSRNWAHERCDFMLTESLVLAQDNQDLFAVMEKTRLVILHGLEPEVCSSVLNFLINWSVALHMQMLSQLLVTTDLWLFRHNCKPVAQHLLKSGAFLITWFYWVLLFCSVYSSSAVVD